jgi:hypothetical protein
MQEPSDDVLARIWTNVGATLAPEFMARLSFEMDVRRLDEWHDAAGDASGSGDQACQEGIIQMTVNSEFLLAEGRCHYPIDRKLMVLLAESLTAEWGRSPDAAQVEADLRRDVAYLLSDHDEGELSEWAFHATVRQQSGVNFADLASLQESFVCYAKGMREQILQHLECVQAALMSRPAALAGLGRASDPLGFSVTLS